MVLRMMVLCLIAGLSASAANAADVALPDAAGASAPASTGAVQKYAVMSSIGDTITLVSYRPATGSRLDQNERQTVTTPSAGFDQSALDGVNDSLTKHGRNDDDVVFVPSSNKHDDEPLFDANRLAPSPKLLAVLAGAKVTRLLVLTKHRAPAHLKLAQQSVGSGSLEGLGFYIDTTLTLQSGDTNEVGIGFLAPFAYFQVSMLELPSGRVLATRMVEASTSRATSDSPDRIHPWNALTNDEKVAMLRTMITEETSNAFGSFLDMH